MLPEFYTLYSVVKVRILLYKSSDFMTDVSTMIVISDQAGFSDGLPPKNFATFFYKKNLFYLYNQAKIELSSATHDK